MIANSSPEYSIPTSPIVEAARADVDVFYPVRPIETHLSVQEMKPGPYLGQTERAAAELFPLWENAMKAQATIHAARFNVSGEGINND